MSGDVTAAIEGMKAYFARSEPKPWPRLDYVHTLLAEVERLRAEVVNLRRSVESAHEHEEAEAQESARLRAEREALVTAIRARADEVAPEVNFEETNAAALEERALAWVLSVLTADPEADQ